MDRLDFKKWMDRAGLTTIDVASGTKIHPQTIQRFLDGSKVNPSTREALRRYKVERELSSYGGKTSTS